jgi:protein required for attachment to host cells
MVSDRMENVHIPASALVLVSDGRRARFLRNKGTPRNPQLILERHLECENPPTREQGTDRAGQFKGPTGGRPSALDQTDWHSQAEERFAAEIADALYEMGHAHQFHELVMVAPPKMLGDLRAKLHPEVADTLIAEVPKDLTNHPIPELGRLLS